MQQESMSLLHHGLLGGGGGGAGLVLSTESNFFPPRSDGIVLVQTGLKPCTRTGGDIGIE